MKWALGLPWRAMTGSALAIGATWGSGMVARRRGANWPLTAIMAAAGGVVASCSIAKGYVLGRDLDNDLSVRPKPRQLNMSPA